MTLRSLLLSVLSVSTLSLSSAATQTGGDDDDGNGGGVVIPPVEPMRVLLEFAGVPGPNSLADIQNLPLASFELDLTWGAVDVVETDVKPTSIAPPVPMAPGPLPTVSKTFIVRGEVDPSDFAYLDTLPMILDVWTDPLVRHMGPTAPPVGPYAAAVPAPAHPCDLFPLAVPPTVADVRATLGAVTGFRPGGEGIVVGVVDGGIHAGALYDQVSAQLGLTEDPVIGGWPADWGTTGESWLYHGNMSAFDVLVTAPRAKLFDLRISDNASPFLNPNRALLSDAISAYSWAIAEHANTGAPHILSNSWGIFNPLNAPDYASNVRHPFTRKVEEALDAGILVMFAAGNCGADPTFPFGSACGPYTGQGQSIWGANGHPRVMTVGASTADSELLCFSSRGPAALEAIKPDFLSVSHFLGFYAGFSQSNFADSGTSAACATTAGICASLLEVVPDATQEDLRGALRMSAADIWSPDLPAWPREQSPGVLVKWNAHSGSGVLNAKATFDYLMLKLRGKQQPKSGFGQKQF